MATYSDSMTGYADFQSTGRNYAIVMAASAVAGTAALYFGDGHLASVQGTSANLAFVAFAGYVALGLSLVMAVAVAGSLMISRRGQQTITISPLGVLRQSRGKERFLAREEILGMAVVPGDRLPRGTMLVTADRSKDLLIPHWLGGYGACLGELQQLGIPTLPPYRRSRTEIAATWFSRASILCAVMLFLQGRRSPIFQFRTLAWLLGGACLVAISSWLYERFERGKW